MQLCTYNTEVILFQLFAVMYFLFNKLPQLMWIDFYEPMYFLFNKLPQLMWIDFYQPMYFLFYKLPQLMWIDFYQPMLRYCDIAVRLVTCCIFQYLEHTPSCNMVAHLVPPGDLEYSISRS
jgi:hypothetical protein